MQSLVALTGVNHPVWHSLGWVFTESHVPLLGVFNKNISAISGNEFRRNYNLACVGTSLSDGFLLALERRWEPGSKMSPLR